MWIALGILILLSDTVFGKLTGDHVCQEEKRYTINVTEYFLRNSTVRSYEWCLQVPPRCSSYTTRLINDSRVVPKEVVDLIDKCCPGYEVKSETCVPICPDCINGICIQGKCQCYPGYKGEHCNTDCGPSEWGENCKFKCTCNHGSCNSKTGSCTCPAGWTGNQCQSPCSDGFYGQDCKEKCKCKSDELCHYVTGECEESVTTTIFSATDKTTFSSVNIFKNPTKSYILNKMKINKNNVVAFKNNGKFDADKNGLLSTTSVVGITETEFPLTEYQDKPEISKMPGPFASNIQDQITDNLNEDKQFINTFTTYGPVQLMKSSKAKVIEKEVSATGTSHPQEENYLNDEAHRGNINQPPVYQNDLVNGASAATAISVAIIVIAVAIVITNHFIRTKKKLKEEAERSKGLPTVSVYTHSIFHTPLPDPPTFENPIFVTPVEISPNTEGQRFETRVVCSMNFPSHGAKDPREYLYDHPPSTGSYRPASIPEPPDIDVSSVQSLPHTEPLYDEIPSGMVPTPVSQPPPSYKSSSLYMNTCGKTRL